MPHVKLHGDLQLGCGAAGAEGSGATSSSLPRSLGPGLDTRMTRGSVVKIYKVQLREHLTLQAELAPWMAAF